MFLVETPRFEVRRRAQVRAKAFVEGGGWSDASERIVWVKRVTIERQEKEREAQVQS